MDKDKIYAVITGDIAKSRELGSNRKKVLKTLKETLNSLRNFKNKSIEGISDIFRGDFFQTAISNPAIVIEIAVLLKTSLLTRLGKRKNINNQSESEKSNSLTKKTYPRATAKHLDYPATLSIAFRSESEIAAVETLYLE